MKRCSDFPPALYSPCTRARFHPSQGEELPPQFSQMTLSRQGSSENPEPPPMYQAPPAVLSQHPPPQTSYIMATTGQPMPPPSGYQPATGHPHPPPPPPPPSQPLMQAPPPPQGYMQPPPQQVRYSVNSRSFSLLFTFGITCNRQGKLIQRSACARSRLLRHNYAAKVKIPAARIVVSSLIY